MREPNPYDPPKLPPASQRAAATGSLVPPRSRSGGLLGVAALISAIFFAGLTVCVSTKEPSIFLVLIVGWVAAPYLVIWLACRALHFWVARAILALAFGGCWWLGFEAFDALDEDAQGGLALLFAPLYQLAGLCLAILLAFAAERIARWATFF